MINKDLMKKISHIKTSSPLILFVFLFIIAGCGPKWTETDHNGIMIVDNEDGLTLGYSPNSGVQLLIVDRYAFKDLNKNGNWINMKTGGCRPVKGQKTWPLK